MYIVLWYSGLCLFLNDTSTPDIYTYCHTLSLHDALPICSNRREVAARRDQSPPLTTHSCRSGAGRELSMMGGIRRSALGRDRLSQRPPDRKSTRLNSSHSCASRMPPSA